jgi:hypothetical protein
MEAASAKLQGVISVTSKNEKPHHEPSLRRVWNRFKFDVGMQVLCMQVLAFRGKNRLHLQLNARSTNTNVI